MPTLSDVLQITRSIPPVASEAVFSIGSFPVTNSFLMIVFIGLLFAVLGIFAVRRFRAIPGRLQGMMEMLYESLLDLTNSIVGSVKHSKIIFPVIATLIIYIAVANMILFIPGLSSIEYGGTAIFRSPMSDFNTTFGLAFAMVLAINIVSIKDGGIIKYLGKFFQFDKLIAGARQGLGAFGMAFVEFLIGLLDIISEVAKVVSLSFRLFGNIFAGEVLAVILLGSLAYFVPSLWMVLSILFGLIQAMVFGALVAAYYSFSIDTEEASS